MNSKKVIVCDLDGTLAPSKASISPDMAEVLNHVLARQYVAVISGGAFPQFQKQLIAKLDNSPERLKNLILFPTMGGACYVYDAEKKGWKVLYEERLSDKEMNKIIKALGEAVSELKIDLSGNYGEIIEKRGSQVTFSGKGQEAPYSVKEKWDPDQSKRKKIIQILKKKIPEFDANLGGISSIDITQKGINKAFAIRKIKEILKVKEPDMIFVGDALYKGGNDESVKTTGIDFIQEDNPNQTLEFLSRYM